MTLPCPRGPSAPAPTVRGRSFHSSCSPSPPPPSSSHHPARSSSCSAAPASAGGPSPSSNSAPWSSAPRPSATNSRRTASRTARPSRCAPTRASPRLAASSARPASTSCPSCSTSSRATCRWSAPGRSRSRPRPDASGLRVLPTTLQAHPNGRLAYARNLAKRRALRNLWLYVMHGTCGGDWVALARRRLPPLGPFLGAGIRAPVGEAPRLAAAPARARRRSDAGDQF